MPLLDPDTDAWPKRTGGRGVRERLGPFAWPTALYRNPRGGVENVKAAATAGLGVALLSLDFPPHAWATLTQRLDEHDITWGYWYHCRDLTAVRRLLAASMTRPVVGINVERELGATLTPLMLAAEVARLDYQGVPALITLGWIPNDADCRPTRDWPTMLEVFPQDAPQLWPPSVKTDHCVQHARERGVDLPIPMWGAYPLSDTEAARIRQSGFSDVQAQPADPAWYPRDRYPLSAVYTVDDTGERWDAWGWSR